MAVGTIRFIPFCSRPECFDYGPKISIGLVPDNNEDLKDVMVVMAMDTGEHRYVRERAPLADGYNKKSINLERLADIIYHTNRFAVVIVRT